MSTAINQQQIAHGAMSHREVRLFLRASFDEARKRYVTLCDELVTALGALGDTKVALDHHLANMKGVEAGWMRDGHFDDLTNDKQREARREDLRGGDPAYVPLRVAATNAREMIVQHEGTIERVKAEIRGARYDMEMAIAEMHAIAGEEDPRGDR